MRVCIVAVLLRRGRGLQGTPGRSEARAADKETLRQVHRGMVIYMLGPVESA